MRHNMFNSDAFVVIELNKLSYVFYFKYKAIDTFKHNLSGKLISNAENN